MTIQPSVTDGQKVKFEKDGVVLYGVVLDAEAVSARVLLVTNTRFLTAVEELPVPKADLDAYVHRGVALPGAALPGETR